MAVKEQITFLGAVRSICENPSFNTNNSLRLLKQPSNDFSRWLNKEMTVVREIPVSMSFKPVCRHR
jgi:hypothetical protein